MRIAQSLQTLKSNLGPSDRMPVVFIGHGNPMNAIEDTVYSRSWTALGQSLPRPQAILVVSAHWMTKGSTLVDVSAQPRTIYDFYGFPPELSAHQYPAQGDPQRARDVAALLAGHHGAEDDRWGLDHGAWSILTWLYPEADVPVFQLSIDITQDLDWHLDIGRTLSALRDQGVLIIGSGNVVHNLRAMRSGAQAHDWAIEFDQHVADKLDSRDFAALTQRDALGSSLRMAHPTVEHYLPALTVAGASNDRDSLFVATDGIDLGSISMRSFVFHGG